MVDEFRPLKDAFGRFATGIAIAGCVGEDGGPVALTINSFTSVSLDPALVLWCIERRASTFSSFSSADHYSLSILKSDQRGDSQRFAGYKAPALTSEEFEVWETGAPILKNRLAAFDCEVVDRFKAGDHIILLGKVLKFDSVDGQPLVYFASNYIDGPNTKSIGSEGA